MSDDDWPPFKTWQEWVAAGYRFRDKVCDRKGCGLPVTEFYRPGDMPFRVDPVTRGPHVNVCGNKERVRAMLAEREREPTPGLDWKRRQAGER